MKAYTNPIENNIKYHSKVSRFNEYYGKQSNDGIDDCQFTLIEQCETHERLKEGNILATQA